MSDTQSAAPPAIEAPSVLSLNAASLARMSLTLIAGYLAQHGLATAENSQFYAGLILVGAVTFWNYLKNANVVKKLVTALQSPAVIVQAAPRAVVPPRIVTVLLIGALCLPGVMLVTGCATSPPSSSAPAADLALAKANYTWDRAFNTTAQLYLKWAPTAPADQKAQVKDLLLSKAWPAVQAADTAATLGQSQTTQDQAAIVLTVTAQVAAIINPPAR